MWRGIRLVVCARKQNWRLEAISGIFIPKRRHNIERLLGNEREKATNGSYSRVQYNATVATNVIEPQSSNTDIDAD